MGHRDMSENKSNEVNFIKTLKYITSKYEH